MLNRYSYPRNEFQYEINCSSIYEQDPREIGKSLEIRRKEIVDLADEDVVAMTKSPVPWKYAINLCGQDFPLRSNFELVAELKKLGGGNMLETSKPSSSKRERFTYHYELMKVPYEYMQMPVKTNISKNPPPHDIEIFVGSAYFVLSREFIQYTLESSLAKDFFEWSRDTYSPDEHFWATLVRVPGVPGEVPRSSQDVTDLQSKTRLVKWNYLEDYLYPPCTGTHLRSVCIYGAGELRWLLNYGHWFANKIDSKVDPVLVKCLAEKVAEQQEEWSPRDPQSSSCAACEDRAAEQQTSIRLSSSKASQQHDLDPALALVADVDREASRQLCSKNAQLNLQHWSFPALEERLPYEHVCEVWWPHDGREEQLCALQQHHQPCSRAAARVFLPPGIQAFLGVDAQVLWPVVGYWD
ncbi:hypothetical protein IHE44_0011469 [Lamprotornis superbus]|uniref:Uncharacterized protein n=1 Tax=Lamprotornis superbus TaxID=245042 RepID=A0A835NIQ6_9PASS|nr:hypothetical protein IHE44_0011469 [Lamprotornis superbus]